MNILKEIAQRLSLAEKNVKNVLELADEGATVPFMARYRKEKTGNLNEVEISDILKLNDILKELEKRKSHVLKTIESQGKLSDELKIKIEACREAGILEDLYLPYKPKKKTRGSAAKEKGLEPLADLIAANTPIEKIQKKMFFGGEGQASGWEEALLGASDILAEKLNEDAAVRQNLRRLYTDKALIKATAVKGKEEEGQKYRDYFGREELSARAPSHRILAMFRAADEGFLKLKIRPDEESGLKSLKRSSSIRSARWNEFIEAMEKDCYKRLLAPSLESETKKSLKEKADAEAIRIFTDNLRVLLMESPLGQKAVLAVDPGLRTGCKIVCLSPQGELLYDGVIYPLEPHNKTAEAAGTIEKLVKRYCIQAVAVGNGTGGREAQNFITSLSTCKNLPVVLVNESGASIYSASEIARKEFPDHDLTVRGAVSIGRRLMDPLAELVKLDPSSIGVGQYQHDVNQKSLKDSLDDTVMFCVNEVGVELNTASEKLLSYVSGMNGKTAAAVVQHRAANGPFHSRKELKRVKGIGEKCFEQASGFLRIRAAENPLDNTGIHPEQYSLVNELCRSLDIGLVDLAENPDALDGVGDQELKAFCTEDRGMETLRDIIAELKQPGRDPREEFKIFRFDDTVNSMEDLEEGMILPGAITNVTAFGAFVDVGVHQDGLIHISQLADRYVSNPADIVKAGQKLKVRILDVDLARKRISCSLKGVDQS